jgi:hypothetical protein
MDCPIWQARESRDVECWRLRNAIEDLWETRFQELIEFKQIHGHCNVPHFYPKGDPKLGNWVDQQRLEKRSKLAGKEHNFKDGWEKRLNSIGFQWMTPCPIWDKQFETFRNFKHDASGDKEIKQDQNEDLYSWVADQRRHYWWKLRGLRTSLTDIREAKLDAIGFNWNPMTQDTWCRWESTFHELLQYNHIHGNFDGRCNPQLTKWIADQRREYFRKKEGKQSRLKEEQEAKLVGVNFPFTTEEHIPTKDIHDFLDHQQIEAVATDIYDV